MTIKTLIEGYLQKQPLFRERRNKDRGIVNLLMNRHFKLKELVESGAISKGFVTELMREYASMDRFWRQTLERDPSLRGEDYDDKKHYEQEKEVQLGYETGYHQDVKKLGTL